ncbi:MAG: lipoyl(octanoyl) transferase LipB [Fimbriimonadaceae bacterium]|nr:MAG: lipoyl(octanoyl) transferase LipB [Fimbriimonadaceae bacterium]
MKGRIVDLGRMAYEPAWAEQLKIHAEVLDGAPDTLIFVEHDPVLTLGANSHEENLLLSREGYQEHGIDVIRTDRGGDVTYHGPGQLVIYPIFDISRHGKDLHKWMRDLEETMILTCAEFGIEAGRLSDVNTGAWVGNKKIAAIGVKVKKWTNLHGIAINCDNDLSVFNLIVPCGVVGHGVTSLSSESDRMVDNDMAKPAVIRAFGKVFDLQF